MGSIGRSFQKLEAWFASFSLEIFASILRPEWIEEALKASGREGERDRKLTAPLTTWLVIAMGLFRTLSIQNVLERMGVLLGVGSLWKDGEVPTSGSDHEARQRLGFGPLRLLLEKLRGWILQTYREAMSWKGMLLLVLDGTTFKVPDSPENRRRWGLPGSSRGRAAFPHMRALLLVSAKLRVVLGALFAPIRRGEITLAQRMLPQIPKGSLVLLDRNFVAWSFLLGIQTAGSHFFVRVRDAIRGTCVSVLGPGDRLVKMPIRSAARKKDPTLPKFVVVRELSARIQGSTFRFFTSLLNPEEFRAIDLVLLYAQRWQEEIALDEIKTHQCPYTTVNRPVILRCRSAHLVLQEVYGLILAYNLVRLLMAMSAFQVGVSPLHISFVDSLERIRSASLVMAIAPTQRLPAIYEELLLSIGRCIVPRRKRTNPRAVCVKMSSYPLKRKAS